MEVEVVFLVDCRVAEFGAEEVVAEVNQASKSCLLLFRAADGDDGGY